MTPETLSLYIKDPSLLDDQTIDGLWALVKEYPYFQLARTLLARNLYNTNHSAYPLSLRLAAAYAGDRSKLKKFIEGTPVLKQAAIQKDESTAVPESVATEPLQVIVDQLVVVPGEQPDPVAVADKMPGSELTANEVISDLQTEIPVQADTKLSGKSQASSLIETIFTRLSHAIPDETDVKSDEEFGLYHQESTYAEVSPTRKELIDKFIKDEPRIGTPKSEFYNPEDKARQSTSLPDDLVSETLARIYEQQGHYLLAIKIYEKLILLIPEKSSYFAAQINEIEKKRK